MALHIDGTSARTVSFQRIPQTKLSAAFHASLRGVPGTALLVTTTITGFLPLPVSSTVTLSSIWVSTSCSGLTGQPIYATLSSISAIGWRAPSTLETFTRPLPTSPARLTFNVISATDLYGKAQVSPHPPNTSTSPTPVDGHARGLDHYNSEFNSETLNFETLNPRDKFVKRDTAVKRGQSVKRPRKKRYVEPSVPSQIQGLRFLAMFPPTTSSLPVVKYPVLQNRLLLRSMLNGATRIVINAIASSFVQFFLPPRVWLSAESRDMRFVCLLSDPVSTAAPTWADHIEIPVRGVRIVFALHYTQPTCSASIATSSGKLDRLPALVSGIIHSTGSNSPLPPNLHPQFTRRPVLHGMILDILGAAITFPVNYEAIRAKSRLRPFFSISRLRGPNINIPSPLFVAPRVTVKWVKPSLHEDMGMPGLFYSKVLPKKAISHSNRGGGSTDLLEKNFSLAENPQNTTPGTSSTFKNGWQEFGFVLAVMLGQCFNLTPFGATMYARWLIANDLGVPGDKGQLSWIAAGFSITTGSFVLVGGRLGDVYGHRPVWFFALVWSMIWNLVSGFARSPAFYDAARGLAGIGAGLMTPTAVALLGQTYPPGRRRNIIFGLFGIEGMGMMTKGSRRGKWGRREHPHRCPRI
ncbi:hypothetical protein DFH06DRAFT_1437735 [Mycena polygramma]|nr:hypothetical protein DFH06DRAFT_1437735 [Mycena polygramma]